MAHPFFIGINFSVDIKPGTGEKSISTGQVRYVIRMIYMLYEKKITYIGFTMKDRFRERFKKEEVIHINI